jgi:hypothetical protein
MFYLYPLPFYLEGLHVPLPLYFDNLQPILSLNEFMFYLQDIKNNSQNACPTCTQVLNTWNIYLTLHDQLVLIRK